MTRTPERATAGNGDPEGRTPAQLLDEMHALRDRAGATARGYWLVLLLFGALICGSLPFYERLARSRLGLAAPRVPGGGCRALLNQPCQASEHLSILVVTSLGYYWQIAIPAVVALTVAWYRWHGNRVGLRTPARGFLITGLILGELVLLGPILVRQSSSPTMARLLHDTHQSGPLVIIAALLWVLAWAERSPILAIIVACYLVTALVVSQYNNGGLAGGNTGAADLSLTGLRLLGLLPALVLLIAGSVAWLTQRLRRRPGGLASGHEAG